MGDSLTVGYGTLDGGAFGREQREPFVLVGTVPGKSGDHEGHGGWRINQIAAHLDAWLLATQPTDVALMIGTNDALSMLSAPAALVQLRALAIRIMRRARLVLATIPRLSGSFAKWMPWQQDYNRGVRQLVTQLQGEGYPITLAEVEQRAVIPSLPDGVHPNGDGYTSIASVMGQAVAVAPWNDPRSASPASTSSGVGVVAFLAALALLAAKGRF